MPKEKEDMEIDEVELFEEQYEKAVQERRHEELIAAISSLSKFLKNDNAQSEVAKLMAENGKMIDAFLKALNEVKVPPPPQELPEIKIEHKTEELVNLISSLGEQIKEGLQKVADKLDNRPDYILTVKKRNEHNQSIESITAKVIK